MTTPDTPTGPDDVPHGSTPEPAAVRPDGTVQNAVKHMMDSVEAGPEALSIGRVLELLQYGHRIVRADLNGKPFTVTFAELEALEAAGETFTYCGPDGQSVIIEAYMVEDAGELTLHPHEVGEGEPNPAHRPDAE